MLDGIDFMDVPTRKISHKILPTSFMFHYSLFRVVVYRTRKYRWLTAGPALDLI